MSGSEAVDNEITSLTYENTYTRDGASTNSHTFTSCDIGTASSNRVVVVAVGVFSTAFYDNPSDPLDDVTVGGVSLTNLSQTHDLVADPRINQDFHKTEIWGGNIPTGTTADITVVMDGTDTSTTFAISVYSLETGTGSVSVADRATDNLKDNDPSWPDYPDDVLSGGVAAIACAMYINGGPSTWSTLTENADVDARSGEYFSSASAFSYGSTIDCSVTGSLTPSSFTFNSVALV